jgi:hypothetical protein
MPERERGPEYKMRPHGHANGSPEQRQRCTECLPIVQSLPSTTASTARQPRPPGPSNVTAATIQSRDHRDSQPGIPTRQRPQPAGSWRRRALRPAWAERAVAPNRGAWWTWAGRSTALPPCLGGWVGMGSVFVVEGGGIVRCGLRCTQSVIFWCLFRDLHASGANRAGARGRSRVMLGWWWASKVTPRQGTSALVK